MESDDDTLRETAQVYKELGEVEYDKGEFQNALSLFTQGIDVKCKDDQLNAQLYFARLNTHFWLGNFQDALEDLNHTQEIADKNPRVLQKLGFDHDMLRAKAQLLKGEVEHDKNDFRKALSCYTEGIELKCTDDKLNAKLYLRRLQSHAHLRNRHEVLEDLNRAKEICQTNDTVEKLSSSPGMLLWSSLLRETAKVYKELGDAELAKEEFQNALSFYTEGINVKCKDEQLNVELYRCRWLSNCRLGKFMLTSECKLSILFTVYCFQFQYYKLSILQEERKSSSLLLT